MGFMLVWEKIRKKIYIFLSYLVEKEKAEIIYREDVLKDKEKDNIDIKVDDKIEDSNKESYNFIDIIRQYDLSLFEYLQKVEKNIIEEVLEITGSNLNLGSKLLKISKRELIEKCKENNLDILTEE